LASREGSAKKPEGWFITGNKRKNCPLCLKGTKTIIKRQTKRSQFSKGGFLMSKYLSTRKTLLGAKPENIVVKPGRERGGENKPFHS